MPDDRLIHLALGHSEKINALTDFERGVWLVYKLTSDDFGVMRFSAVSLQEAAGWLEAKPSKTVLRALEAVRDHGLLQTFEHQTRLYCFQTDWQTWQKITHPRQTKQPAPPFERCDLNTQWLLSHHPKGGKLKSWQPPGENRERTGSLPEVLPVETGPVFVSVGSGCVGVEKNSARASDFPERARATNEETSLALRAGDFLERYRALHVRLRNARYVGKEHVDFQEAKTLVGIYDDDGMLDKLAFTWLNTNHDFAEAGTRTVAKFRSMASWCEEQVHAWEQKHGRPFQVAS